MPSAIGSRQIEIRRGGSNGKGGVQFPLALHLYLIGGPLSSAPAACRLLPEGSATEGRQGQEQ